MSISTSRQSYADCYRALDQAIEDERGVRIKMDDHDAATFFRMRVHMARKINRQDNARTYEEDHPMYNASVYDKLVVRIRRDGEDLYIYIEHVGLDLGEIEPLSGVEENAALVTEAREPEVELVVEPLQRRV